MPIIYNSEEKAFILQDPTTEEKNALFNIACDQITEMFGKQVTDDIIRSAAAYHQSQVDKRETPEDVVGVYNTPTIN